MSEECSESSVSTRNGSSSESTYFKTSTPKKRVRRTLIKSPRVYVVDTDDEVTATKTNESSDFVDDENIMAIKTSLFMMDTLPASPPQSPLSLNQDKADIEERNVVVQENVDMASQSTSTEGSLEAEDSSMDQMNCDDSTEMNEESSESISNMIQRYNNIEVEEEEDSLTVETMITLHQRLPLPDEEICIKKHDDFETSDTIKELQLFLNTMKEKTDSNGNPLIVFPDNFDDIVHLMTQEDIHVHSNWATVLLQQGVGKKRGTYSNGDVSDSQVKNARAFASIRKLDLQLQQAEKKLKNGKVPSTHGEYVLLNLQNNSLSTRSVASEESPLSSRSLPPVPSNLNNVPRLHLKKHQHQSSTSLSSRPKRSSQTSLNFIDRNRETAASKTKSELTVEDSLRIQQILENNPVTSCSDQPLDENNSSSVGYVLDKERITAIDTQLQEFMNLRNENNVFLSSIAEKDHDKDPIHVYRKVRLETKRLDNINASLYELNHQNWNNSKVNNNSDRPCTASSQASSILSIQEIDTLVKEGRKEIQNTTISNEEIQRLLLSISLE